MKRTRWPHRILIACLFAGTGLAACASAADVPPAPSAVISPDDPRLVYVGRFDHRDPAGPRCEWPASTVTARFRGTAIRIKVADVGSGNDDFEVIVDHDAPRVVHPGRGPTWIDLASNLADGEHQVQLVKRTEAIVGCAQIQGFELGAGGILLEAQRLPHRVEVIGDSMSCGYGNEAANQKQHFSPRTENAYMAYGAIAARAVDAQYVCIAWSGRTMWPDNTLPEIYDRTLPSDPTSKWNFADFQPEAVLINLATNDFRNGVPDAQSWTAAYESFVRRVRGNYPTALIYLASGTMISDAWPPGQKQMTTLNGYLDRIQSDLRAAGDDRIRIIRFGTQDATGDGLGADYHPSIKTDQKMAARFVAALAADLGWSPSAATLP
jgi:hypothetical protein